MDTLDQTGEEVAGGYNAPVTPPQAQQPNDQYNIRWWLDEIGRAEKRLKQNFWDTADKIVDRYLDKRGTKSDNEYRYNIFWANIGILKAALYANPPEPMVTRQFNDFDDDVARVAANILERNLKLDLQRERSDVDFSFRYAVEDRLIAGMGQIWHRYDVNTEEYTIPAITDPQSGMELAPEVQASRIVSENVVSEYVHWRDFLYGACRVWEECPWVARRVYLDDLQVATRFGQDIAGAIKRSAEASKTETADNFKDFKREKTEIFEIWCKLSKKVYWVCKTYPDRFLDEKDDFLGLPGMFPCGCPLVSTVTTSEFIPRPDYLLVEDQYRELDELNTRIVLLEKSLRVAGVYDRGNAEVKQLVTDARENIMVPVDQWAALAEKNGLKGVLDFLPIDTIAKVLDSLMVQRQDKVNQIYELTGISDIMRGVTSPRETARAQSLKAQYSSARLQYLQQEVALFVQETLRIRAEIMCRKFQPQTLLERSQIKYSVADAQYAPQAVQLLQDTGLSRYRIEVNADSLAIPDYNAERDSRVQFLTTVGGFIGQSMELVQVMPQSMPILMKMLQWVAAGFRSSKEIEGILDQAVNMLSGGGAQQMMGQGGGDQAGVTKEQIGLERDKLKGQNTQTAEAEKRKTIITQGIVSNLSGGMNGGASQMGPSQGARPH